MTTQTAILTCLLVLTPACSSKQRSGGTGEGAASAAKVAPAADPPARGPCGSDTPAACEDRATAAYVAGRYEEALILAYSAPVAYYSTRDLLAARLGREPDWEHFAADPAHFPDPAAFYRADRDLDRTAALHTLETRCDARADLDACVMAGLVRDDRKLATPAVTFDLFRRGCDGGQIVGCFSLGYCYEKATCTAKDLTKAGESYEKACAGGLMSACSNLGYCHESGTCAQKDMAKAAHLYATACEHEERFACGNLGRCYEKGTCTSKDPAKAAPLYARACTGGNMVSCSNLGFCYDNGTCAPKNSAEAARLYGLACEGGAMVGCLNLGYCYEHGTCAPKDNARAAQLYAQACEGDLASCGLLGYCYAQGTCTAKDNTKAAALFRKACEGGDKESCTNLKIVQRGH